MLENKYLCFDNFSLFNTKSEVKYSYVCYLGASGNGIFILAAGQYISLNISAPSAADSFKQTVLPL